MIVLDASAAIDLLVESPVNGRLYERVVDAGELNAPHLIDVEVWSVLRRLESTGALSADACGVARANFEAWPIIRYPHEPIGSRVWDLRRNVTAYDATYVALAEVLDLPLVTSDRRLARSKGHAARVESFARGR